jgi:hypothetical protein
MPAYDDDPHQSASPPRSRGMRACLKTRMPPDVFRGAFLIKFAASSSGRTKRLRFDHA